ncbi:MAG TPA: HAMP domain-containing sensor histidine kinase [Gaiellaceae bacterium]|nr:HAMP domain-containing sensor histidine kinase [Gaiellaceae bacterium]
MIAVALYLLTTPTSLVQSVVYGLIGFAGVLAIAAGALRNVPRHARAPWLFFGAGLLMFVCGDAVFHYYVVGGGTAPFPSAADALYLAAYPLLFFGMASLIRQFGKIEGSFVVVDALIVTCAFALVQWVFLIQPASRLDGHLLQRVVDVAYPAMDILLVAPLARLLMTPVARIPALGLLVFATVLQLVGDEIYYGRSSADYNWLDAFWLGSYVVWGAAALHPSARRLSSGLVALEPGLGFSRLVLLGASLMSAPLVLLVEDARGDHPNLAVIGAGAIVISVLVVLRIGGLLRALAQIRGEEHEARLETEAARALLAEQNEQLREFDRLKDEFIALVSHELRTPLTSIGGYAELLDDDETGPLNEEQRSFVEIIARQTERLLSIVNDLLFVARIQAGELELNLEDVDLAEVAVRSIEAATPRADAKHLELVYERDGVTHVLGEPQRLGQLLDNLLSNAIKFTPDGGEVKVRTAATNGSVVLEVTDSGIGIPASEHDRLFERFFRSSSAVSGQIPGTGLGLYITKAITEAHDGRIDVESSEGQGTAFRVTLPRAEFLTPV